MKLEKFFETVLSNPENIKIEYSNVNGKEKLVVNGKDILEDVFDDYIIKEQIQLYKKNISYIDESLWNLIIEEAKNREYNLKEMDRILNLDSYTQQEALQAQGTISIMSELINEVLKQEVQSLIELMERF